MRTLQPQPTGRLVLWGGKPGHDIQVGSFDDRRRLLVQRHIANAIAVGRAFERTLAQINVTIQATAEPLVRDLRKLSAAAAAAEVGKGRRR